MTRKYVKGNQPSGGETTWTNTGVTRYGRGQHKTGSFGYDMLRPSPNHGTQRLPNDDDDDDEYNTRIASDLHTFRYYHTFARKSLRHYLVQTINNTPDNVFSKFGTHSLNGFSNYAKLNVINNYQDECNIHNCYICSQIQPI